MMMYVKYRLSLRSVEDLVSGRAIDLSHETVRRNVADLRRGA
jgi:transposase-like protein